jgi:hypothetical protein
MFVLFDIGLQVLSAEQQEKKDFDKDLAKLFDCIPHDKESSN